MNIFQWLELQRHPVFPLIYPGTAHRLPVGVRQYGAFPQLDIYIRSFRKIPAQRLKIGLFTQQHFKPDMAFTGHLQDCRHFITVNLPQKLAGDIFADSRRISEQLLCRRLRQHDLLRVFLHQGRIARYHRETEHIKEGRIHKCILRFDQICSRMKVQHTEVEHKSRILHLWELLP